MVECELKNLKSNYVFQKVFNNLTKKKSLEILKYNNKTKQRLNLNINDYKKYCEIYSSIEIEIRAKNKEKFKFINIKESEKKYYHIYFNDNEKEIKRDYIIKYDYVTKINIRIDYQIGSF